MSPQPPYLLLNGPRFGTNSTSLDSQFGFAWESPNPAQIADFSDCFSSYRMAPGRAQMVGDLSLHHLGNLRALHTQWTTTDHIRAPPPYSCTADLPRRAEVGGRWSQPVLADDWPGKSPPLTCQQQPSLKHKRRVYSAHMEGPP